ncbi:hypothetical protein [Robbsia sp. KACC 23696]|uniref:hypothetical protein n=1 Tax=Robbsia sp. KACC 23696 TaxID=3149231 RepID=UPI00325A9769
MNLPASNVDIQEAPLLTTSVMAHWLDAPEHCMTYLRGQVRNSAGCTAIYLTHVALSKAMKRHAPAFLDWDNTDQDNRDYEA